jgi:hypothetical protein
MRIVCECEKSAEFNGMGELYEFDMWPGHNHPRGAGKRSCILLCACGEKRLVYWPKVKIYGKDPSDINQWVKLHSSHTLRGILHSCE